MNLARLAKGIGVLKFLSTLYGYITDSNYKYIRVFVPGSVEFWIQTIDQYCTNVHLTRLYELQDFDLLSQHTFIVDPNIIGEKIFDVRKVATSQAYYNRFSGCIIEVVRVVDTVQKDLSFTIHLSSFITRLDALTVAHEVLAERNVGKVVLDKVMANVSAMIGLWDFELIERCISYQLVDASDQSLSFWRSTSLECPRLMWDQNSDEIHPLHKLTNEPAGENWFRQYLASTQMSVMFPILESIRMDIISILHKKSMILDRDRDILIDGDYQLLHKRCGDLKHKLRFWSEIPADVRVLYVDIRCELAHSRPVSKAKIMQLDDLNSKYRSQNSSKGHLIIK